LFDKIVMRSINHILIESYNNMKKFWVVLLVLFVVACGEGDDPIENDDPVVEPYQPTGGRPKYSCVTYSINQGFYDKENAPGCIGLSTNGNVSCLYHPENNITTCVSGNYWYNVVWVETASGTRGDVYGGYYPDSVGRWFMYFFKNGTGVFQYYNWGTNKDVLWCSISNNVAKVCTANY
jgi:hypothetical protein